MSWKKNLTISTFLSVTALTGIYILNKFIYIDATKNNYLKTSKGLYYDWKFGKIFYTKQGSGQPLLLVHDLTPSSSSYEWKNIIEKLSEQNTVYTLDLIGCGRSDKPNLTYTNYLYVQLVTDFIKNVICNKVNIITTGLSGSFIFGASHNDNTIIDKIIVVNPASINELSESPAKRSKTAYKLIHLPVIGTMIYNLFATKKLTNELFNKKYFHSFNTEVHPLVYYESSHIGHASPKYIFASLAGHYLTANVPHYLENLTNSIFIITGEGTPENITIAHSYCKLLPSIEVVKMEKAKHLPQLEYPDEFMDQIRFLLS